MLASQWVWQRTKSGSIPTEEQNAGRVVDYFYRMEFHITPRFFSDSNGLTKNVKVKSGFELPAPKNKSKKRSKKQEIRIM